MFGSDKLIRIVQITELRKEMRGMWR